MDVLNLILSHKRQEDIMRKQHLLLLLLLWRRQRRRRLEKTRAWTKFDQGDRFKSGHYHCLLQELRLKDHETFVYFNRMTPNQFDVLLKMIGPVIQKQTTQFREPISPGERLSITLRYLTTGDSKKGIAKSYMIGYSTTCQLIHETCEAIWNVLQTIYLKVPTRKHLHKIANDFWKYQKFPNCIGPMNAKQVTIQASTSKLQKSPNVIFFASCDSEYRFTLIAVEDYTKRYVSYSSSTIAQLLDTRMLKLPKPNPLPGEIKATPYFFLGSTQFPLKEHTMKPYSQRNCQQDSRALFNSRAEQTLQVLENAMGLLRGRWQIFKSQIVGKPENAMTMVKAACCLQNFLLLDDKNVESRFMYCPPGYVDRQDESGDTIPGQWRSEIGRDSCFVNLPRMIGSNMYKKRASKIRDHLAEYFLSEAANVKGINLKESKPMEIDSQ